MCVRRSDDPMAPSCHRTLVAGLPWLGQCCMAPQRWHMCWCASSSEIHDQLPTASIYNMNNIIYIFNLFYYKSIIFIYIHLYSFIFYILYPILYILLDRVQMSSISGYGASPELLGADFRLHMTWWNVESLPCCLQSNCCILCRGRFWAR